MSGSDDDYAFFMREIIKDVPGDHGVYMPMQTFGDVYENFVPKLQGDARFRGLLVNFQTAYTTCNHSSFLY
jgi:hypothetical protein